MKEKVLLERGYLVTEDGVVYNRFNKCTKIHKNSTGYFCIRNWINKKPVRVSVHRLQAYQKYGDLLYQKEIMVRHLNGNKEDNSWENIAIGTARDNYYDVPESIRFRILKQRLESARVKNKKYNNKDIIAYYNENKSYIKTMKKFNISSKGTLWFILNKAIDD